MEQPKYQVGDRQFYELSGDLKAIVTGITARDVCMTEISILTGEPIIVVSMRIRDKTIEAIKRMSPNEIAQTIKAVSSSDD